LSSTTHNSQSKFDASYSRVAGRISIELTDEEMSEVKQIARARNESYQSGKTYDSNYTDDAGVDHHIRGVTAEYGLALLYDESEIDRDVYEQGDDGVDAQLRLDGGLLDVDIKASSYENCWLLVKQSYDHTNADAYITSYIDGQAVELTGFAFNSEIIDESMLEPSPSSYHDHQNYTKREDFRRLPVPNQNVERADFEIAE
jgi:hypothetical protein